MSKAKKKNQSVHEALIELYLKLKPTKNEDEELSPEEQQEEYNRLLKKDSKTLIKYIDDSIDIIVQVLTDEKVEEYNKANDDPQTYENLLIKLESDIRGHIRVEHQLKLHSDNLQNELDEMTKQLEKMEPKAKKFLYNCSSNSYYYNNNNTSNSNITNPNQIDDNNNTVTSATKTELITYKQLLKSYEKKNLDSVKIEKRLKSQLTQKDKELKHIDDNYKEQVRVLNKKIFTLEEKIRNNGAMKISTFRDDSVNKNNNTDNIINSNTNNNNNISNNVNSITSNRKINSAVKHSPNSKQKIDHFDKKILGDSRDKSFNKTDNTNGGVNKSHSTSFVIKGTHEISSSKYVNKKNEEIIPKLVSFSKRAVQELNAKKKGHNRHKSMQDNLHMKTQKVNMIKEMLYNSHHGSSSHQRKTSSQSKMSEKTMKKTCTAIPSNFVINQTGAPFVNNINIYTTNTHNNNSTGNNYNNSISNNTNNNNNNNQNNKSKDFSKKDSHHNHNNSSIGNNTHNHIYQKPTTEQSKRKLKNSASLITKKIEKS